MCIDRKIEREREGEGEVGVSGGRGGGGLCVWDGSCYYFVIKWVVFGGIVILG